MSHKKSNSLLSRFISRTSDGEGQGSSSSNVTLEDGHLRSSNDCPPEYDTVVSPAEPPPGYSNDNRSAEADMLSGGKAVPHWQPDEKRASYRTELSLSKGDGKRLPLPPTAKALFEPAETEAVVHDNKSEEKGKATFDEDDAWGDWGSTSKKKKKQKGLWERRQPRFSPFRDPAVFEFELTCFGCFEFESLCSCESKQATTIMAPGDLPLAEDRYGSLPIPGVFIRAVSMSVAHLTSTVAHALWPLLARGIIPIITEEAVVLVRSHTLERMASARAFLESIAAPMTCEPTTDVCRCGCGEILCARVALTWNLYTNPEVLERAHTVLYTIGKRTWSAVRVGNGITCFTDDTGDMRSVETKLENEFVLSLRIFPQERFSYCPGSYRLKEPWVMWKSFLSWEAMLDNVLNETLLGREEHNCMFTCYGAMLQKDRGHFRGVVHAGSLGAGTGNLVVEGKCPAHSDSSRVCDTSTLPNEYWSSATPLDKLEAATLTELDQEQDVMKAAPGAGWEHLSPKSSGLQITPKVGCGAGSKWFDIRCPQRPYGGVVCTGLCKDRPAMAICRGFSHPKRKTAETTVYKLGSEALPYTIVAMYAHHAHKMLYLVHHWQCLGCTVHQVPQGSIVAGVLPPVKLMPRDTQYVAT